jgi:DNA-binding NarL/FixJ family response regulator
MTTSVVVVEDEAMVRAGLCQLLDAEADLSVVGEAGDGLEAQHLVQALRPDVVVMDVRLPNVDGIEATRRLIGLPSPPAVLLLTTFGSEKAMIEGLRAGASGFFLKSARPEQLADAVRVVAAGECIVAPAMTRALVDRAVHTAGGPAALAQERPASTVLSTRERDVLRRVASGDSNSAIAETLCLSPSTVKSHVRHIIAKLGVKTRTQAIVAARTAMSDAADGGPT